jgi:hypothetical protein
MLAVSDTYLTGEDVLREIPAGTLKSLVYRGKVKRVQRACKGTVSLYDADSFPAAYRDKLYAAYPELSAAKKAVMTGVRASYLEENILPDPAAMEFYRDYFAGKNNEDEQVRKYYANAVILNACGLLWEKSHSAHSRVGKAHKLRRCDFWAKMKLAIEALDAQRYPHSLNLSWQKLMYKFDNYVGKQDKPDYLSLVNGRIGNQNRSRVTPEINKLLVSLYSTREKPFAADVCRIYNEFLLGFREIVNSETGEVFNRDDFYKQGAPISLSESTVWNWLNRPENRRVADSLRNDFHYNQDKHNPYALRYSPEFALSKISLDDRDLVRKAIVCDSRGNKTTAFVHAYYAYDVASGAVLGAAWSLKKDTRLIMECMRDMWRNLRRWGLNIPMEAEIENHLMHELSERLDNTFQRITWCAPMNSREKRAEHLNKSKKYYGAASEKSRGMAHGRHYAKQEAYLFTREKIFDEDNNNYKQELEPADFDSVVAEDRAQIAAYNSSKYRVGNKKQFNKDFDGMTRMEILQTWQNRHLAPLNWRLLSKNWGFETETSLKNSSICRVQYKEWRISSPDIIDRLNPNDYDVKAYYLDMDDEIERIFIYQDGRFIDECREYKPFNEAVAERTDEDIAIMHRQLGYKQLYKSKIKAAKQEIIAPLVAIPVERLDAVMQRAPLADEQEAVAASGEAEELDYTEEMSDEDIYAMALSQL